MAQHTSVAAPVRHYTRADFTALRFRLNRVPTSHILNKVYHEDALLANNIETPAQLESWLDEMRDHLVERLCLSNPYLSDQLADARKFNRWSKGVVDFLVKAADQDTSRPMPADSVSAWFRPVVYLRLREEHVLTLAQLKEYIEMRGPNWFMPVQRVGAGKARAIERWLAANALTLGPLKLEPEKNRTDLVVVGRGHIWVPFERMGGIVKELDGSEGLNRASGFCLIAARHDFDAIRAYLYRYRDRDKTARSYQKELERFLLWCVWVERKPMSSVGTDECERYKDFLANPDPTWIGQSKARRLSSRWRPFAGQLSPESRLYTVRVLRAFFDWLAAVRYLGGNPWITVSDPVVDQKEHHIDIDKALPGYLWAALSQEDGILDRVCARYTDAPLGRPLLAREAAAPAAQYRLARAAILLMGSTGLRRAEAASATRDRLKPVPRRKNNLSLWELSVLGKRRKWRTVFFSERVVDAIRAHWLDRGHNFDYQMHELAVLSPVVVPATKAAKDKHFDEAGNLTGNGFDPASLYLVLTSTLLRIANDEALPLDEVERELLRQVAPHALRHTWATDAVARQMPLDVVQRLLGHASLSTTSIYARAERERSIDEVAKLYDAAPALHER
ncbi:tyrosine-type recombinase/integrase [Paraburkholderia aspalathi]|nr:phage integrase family protein [Paraburkholderia aspalathi]MBK3780036.1 tyrosine-type recombinase/integrase [Paraburkholderia aspalathi]